MEELLKEMGLSVQVRDFFEPFLRAYSFDDLRLMKQGYWTAGQNNPSLVSHVFLCCSAVELIAFYQHYLHRYKNADQLLFIATGPLPDKYLISGPGKTYKFKKFVIIHSNDILGRVWSVKVAGWLLNKNIYIEALENTVLQVSHKHKVVSFSETEFNLNTVELRFGFRSKIKTVYPRAANTFMEQLQSGY